MIHCPNKRQDFIHLLLVLSYIKLQFILLICMTNWLVVRLFIINAVVKTVVKGEVTRCHFYNLSEMETWAKCHNKSKL